MKNLNDVLTIVQNGINEARKRKEREEKIRTNPEFNPDDENKKPELEYNDMNERRGDE